MRVFDALRAEDFRCLHHGSGLQWESSTPSAPLDPPPLPSSSFETVKPNSLIVRIPSYAHQASSQSRGSLFRYFLDGSERFFGIGHIVDPRSRYLPLFLAQTAVAVTTRKKRRLSIHAYEPKTLLLIPRTFSKSDTKVFQDVVTKTLASSRRPITIQVKDYEPEGKGYDEAAKKARAAVLNEMHRQELTQADRLINSTSFKPSDFLMIDGSLAFPDQNSRMRAAFRNVVAVAKSFDPSNRVGKGKKARDIGEFLANLPPACRTPVFRSSASSFSSQIAYWYLRLRAHSSFTNPEMGVVKVEVYLDSTGGKTRRVNTNRCNRISYELLALRYPITPIHDARWASHLYPIHVTERYLKARFSNPRQLAAYF